MARILLRPLKTLTLITPPLSRSYISYHENLLRIVSTELTYLCDYHPPLAPPPSYRSFLIDDRPGEPWVRLKSEGMKIDATMFDGVAPIPAAEKKVYEGETRLHVSLVVEISKGDTVLEFVCSAWPDSLQVDRIFPITSKTTWPYMGNKFKDLPEEVQKAFLGYLEEREVDDELAEFLHEYMANKEKIEHLRWMKRVETFVSK